MEMVEIDIYLGGSSKQNLCFVKRVPKNLRLPLLFRIGPTRCLAIFLFLMKTLLNYL